ncbi:hypothetical protein P5G51_014760 [Virgibacillus sp. 179-BFC.A HS]|uniref:DUF4083 domain-containing protein n=1 Tax=Tigheibacillus jepli TaxID=3035914 RepID=A0ABU5CJH1_9BACI|nr:hypothetical protein [Virgibacillus sp. 179-BFC.A HS]MDY0406455.1 hypothetical protein [Virgibacillus sp. 179-BFC.A HS]
MFIDSWSAFWFLIPTVLYLIVIVFAVYFVLKIMKFMNEKIKLDREKNEKLTEIIQALNQDKEMK